MISYGLIIILCPSTIKPLNPQIIKKGGNSQGDIDAKYKTTVLGRKGGEK